MLVLIVCSKSPYSVGTVVWNENPTVCALIKMIVSNRYRFPTVDCDDTTRDNMKRGEQAARDKVCMCHLYQSPCFLLDPRTHLAWLNTVLTGIPASGTLVSSSTERS
jgi:hypothetical protein